MDQNSHESSLYLQLLKQMLLIRKFEEKAAQMYGLRKINGFLHLYIGEEAVGVGSIAACDLKKDYILTGYRDHGHAIACGCNIESLMAELYAKETGCSRGKGGSMHFFDTKNHFYGGNGIVGAHIPLAAGVALKLRYKSENGVVLCFFGDGAIHQGSFHETLNLSKIWNLPIVFICENNQYGMGTNFRRVSSVDDFSIMGKSYNIPGYQINGMNVLTVYDEVKTAISLSRENKTPVLLEIKTYRYKGHSMSDPAKYRTKEELKTYKMEDPILILKIHMQQQQILSDEQFIAIEKECKEQVQSAIDFAEQSVEPSLKSLYEDVLA